MRILLIADDLELGGVSTVVVNLAGELVARGYEVGVMASDTGALWDELPATCARHYSPSRFSIFAFPRALRRAVADGGYTVVHAHQRGVALWAKIALRGLGVPIVEHVHNQFRANALSALSFRGDRLIACGSAVERMLVDEFGRRADRVDLVLNGVPEVGAIDSDRRPGAGEGFHILGVGRLSEQKDPERFVRVISELRPLLPHGSLRATWVGDGPLRADVERLIDDHDLSGVVALTGARDDIPEQLAAADLLLLTSRREGLPLVILEALRAGRGVVTPSVGSCADAVRNGVDGRLYAPDLSDAALAALLAEDLMNARAAEWGPAARESFLARFTLTAMTDGVVTTYRKAARHQPHPVD